MAYKISLIAKYIIEKEIIIFSLCYKRKIPPTSLLYYLEVGVIFRLFYHL